VRHGAALLLVHPLAQGVDFVAANHRIAGVAALDQAAAGIVDIRIGAVVEGVARCIVNTRFAKR